MNPSASPGHAVTDASLLVGLCAREPGRYLVALTALQEYVVRGYDLYAPSLVVMETVYVLCRKLQDSVLTEPEHATALTNLQALLTMIKPPPKSDVSLISRAEQIRQGYGCTRSADSMYIALAELLTALGPTELCTFDAGQQKQAAAMAPSVAVHLLSP